MARENEKTLEEYMAEIRIDLECPGLLFNWNNDVVALFAKQANITQENEAAPTWMTFPDGQMSPQSLMNDIVDRLKAEGGGEAFDSKLIAPNTCEQFAYILIELGSMQKEPFVQTVMKQVIQTCQTIEPPSAQLAQISIWNDNSKVKGIPLLRKKCDPGFVHIFG